MGGFGVRCLLWGIIDVFLVAHDVVSRVEYPAAGLVQISRASLLLDNPKKRTQSASTPQTAVRDAFLQR